MAFVIVLVLSGCYTVPKIQARDGNKIVDEIQTAIKDFSATKKLFKNESVFFIDVLESVNNDSIVVVRIGKNNQKFLLTKEAKIGSTGKLPSRFMEVKGKLFYWQDANYSLSQEALAIFNKYNLLKDDQDGTIKMPDFQIDDAQKNAHYYFCKNRPDYFKRIITNIGLGYYTPPDLRCDSKK